MEKVAVIGASPKEERYSNKAIKMLNEYNHTPIPVAPGHNTIEGLTVHESLDSVTDDLDTVTLYLAPARQEKVIRQIIEKSPKRVIFNPGTENPAAREMLESENIQVVEACTLVMLRTNQY